MDDALNAATVEAPMAETDREDVRAYLNALHVPTVEAAIASGPRRGHDPVTVREVIEAIRP